MGGKATMDKHPPLQHHLRQPSVPSVAQSVLVAASLLLLVTWLAAWLFDLGQPLVHATALVIVILAMAAIGVRLAWGDAPRRTMPGSARGKLRDPSGLHTLALRADTQDGVAGSTRGKHWSLEVFATIDAPRFVAVCETWFSWAGFDTRHECHRTHEGVDIWLHTPKLAGPVAIVRCKHAQSKPIGLQELREFQGVVASCKDAHGTFTTTSSFTPEALLFAQENGIEVVDGPGLLRRILTRTQRSQQALLAVAYHGR